MVREQLKQAFVSVDREHFGIIGDRLAARMVMRGEEDRPGRQSQIAELEEQISSGCVAAVALLLANQIYVANVGDCSAFLVQSAGEKGISLTSGTTGSSLEGTTSLAALATIWSRGGTRRFQ